MARMKPAALLLQSKRKKGPARLSVATIVACNVVVILLTMTGVFIHKQRVRGAMNEFSSIGAEMGAEMDQVGVAKEELTSRLNVDQLPRFAIFNTTKGVISVELFPKAAPKTVENFVTHSKKGYYNDVSFHRVIKGFMIQAGDPRGDGTGGESIWGGYFKDEFESGLEHEAFTVSMANTGKPNTNGSQFFITTVGTPHLNNHHTVFGRVVSGQDVVQEIENVDTTKEDRPIIPVLIRNISVTDELL